MGRDELGDYMIVLLLVVGVVGACAAVLFAVMGMY